MIAPPAPHAPYTAAKRHSNTFENIKALRTPNFNIPSGELGKSLTVRLTFLNNCLNCARKKIISDKHWLLRMPPATLQNLESLDIITRKRWQSLLAVDEMVANIVQALEENHLYNNTYIMYTSDNGYHIGQFAQAFDKRQPYETDIRVPFIISGPQIPPKIVYDHPVALIDIFPSVLTRAGEEDQITIAIASCQNFFHLKGISLPNIIDGQSFFDHDDDDDTVLSSDYSNRQILIEYWGEGNWDTYNSECKWHKGDLLQQCTIDAECKCQDAWNNTYSCIRQISVDKKENKIFCEFKDREVKWNSIPLSFSENL